MTAERFVKSSYSNTGGDCVEVAALPRGAVVRDGRRADGSVLRFSVRAWGRLLASAQAPARGSARGSAQASS